VSDNSSRDEFISDGEFIENETSPYVDLSSPRRKKSRPLLFLGSLIAVIVLGIAGYFIISHYSKSNDTQKIAGKVAMSADELRSVVLAKHLTVYWAGPMAGAKYALIANKPGQSFVRYLPNGNGLNDTTTSFRVIATYAQKGAFLVTQSAGGVSGNVGFTNVDGNAVFYVKTRPTNVYMGIKDKDIQIEIFDPGIDQALGLSLIHNQIQQIA
jgi:hypothetical protein